MTVSRNHHRSDRCTQWLLMAQAGDANAFAECYSALRPMVGDYLAFLGRQLCPHEREDLTQEAFLRVWQHLSSYRGEASAKTFVFAIARNVLAEHSSRRRRLERQNSAFVEMEAAVQPPGWREQEAEECAGALRFAIANLTEAQRQAVELDLVRGLPRREAARLAGCTLGQFAKRLHRAKESLRQMLGHVPH